MINRQANSPEKYIVLLSMIYMALFFASITVGYKIVAVGHSLYCASILIFPLLFPFSDALSEIYGAKVAKSMVWYTIICEIIFVTLTNVAIRLPSPPAWVHQPEYNFLVGGYVHILLANSTALLISFYLNIIVLNKWRVILKGKHYYFRSVAATAMGEISYTVITNIIAYAGIMRWPEILNIIVSDYLMKMIYSLIIAYPAALLVTYTRMNYSSAQTVYFNPFENSTIKKVVEFSQYAKRNVDHPPA